MTTDTVDSARSTPWWFWVVAVLSLAWNAIGGHDYTMSHVQGVAYLRQAGMSAAAVAYVESYPSWMHAVWAIGVWGAVAGSLLLLLRLRWALHAFVLSFLGAAGSMAHTAITPGGVAAMGLTFPGIICVVWLVLAWFSWAMTKRGVLR